MTDQASDPDATDERRAVAMDRPAYELVRLLESVLDDGDQAADSPEHPSTINIWAVREVLEDFVGKPHRWSHPRCLECNHTVGFHNEWCWLCDCMLTENEVLNGRDESLEQAIEAGLREEGE